jgi:hypothetical protein
MGLVLVGLCVFAWGLQYKLSLYDPPHAISHRMPAAKLLTGKERPEVSPVGLYRATRPTGPAVVLVFTLAIVLLGNARLFAVSSSRAAWPVPVRLARSRFAAASCLSRPPPRSF